MNLKHVTVNKEQQLYVIPEGEGYSCLGFDVCQKWTAGLYKELCTVSGEVVIQRDCERGSIEAYNYYQDLVKQASKINDATGYRFGFLLQPALVGLEGKRVEVTSKDGEKRRFWVGKSTGFIPVHLEIASKRSSGGGATYINDTDTIKVL